jgi:hypothetical protein
VNYKAVVFEFTSPLTPYGSSTSGHAGSGDRYLFPEYSILEWIPSENTVLASFLVVRKVDPTAPFPIEAASETGNNRGKGKSKKSDKKGKGADKETNGSITQAPLSSTDTPQKPDAATPQDNNNTDTKPEPGTPAADSTSTPTTAANDANLKEYWQPITFRIHASNPKILEPLSRVVKPADEVRKYMNEVMDRAERAPDGFLALRLPREKVDPAVFAEENRGTPVSASGTAPGAGASRSRASVAIRRGGKLAGEESEVDQLPPETEEEEEEEEEDLMDFYDPPDGLPPLGA